MDYSKLIRSRKSIRTFDGRPLTEADRNSLARYVNTIPNPYGIPVRFVFLDAEKLGLSSPVITGEHLYIAGKVPKVPHCEEAFGYSFEKMVLYAWSLGIGTTWIGGTMNRAQFEAAAGTGEDEIMMIVSPLGYPSAEKAEVDIRLRSAVHGDERLSPSVLFYDRDFSSPIREADCDERLEAVRWAPSAANMQPWRVVRDGTDFHFYERHADGYRSSAAWDVQAIDLGIALCHFMSVTDGRFHISDPGIETDGNTEYIATVTL